MVVLSTIFFVIVIYRRRVFILGPSHHVRLSGCALSELERYETPLYDLLVDPEGKLGMIQSIHNLIQGSHSTKHGNLLTLRPGKSRELCKYGLKTLNFM